MANTDDAIVWESVITSDGTMATPRHEAGSIVVNGKLYLLGGRGNRPVEVYDPETNGWQSLGAAPAPIHHYQAVAIGAKIYLLGAMACCYPTESSVAEIHVFDTDNNNWSIAGLIPVDRRRGGGGAVVRNDKIYLLGGNTMGHSGGAVGWFDEYDPTTGAWTTLPSAPNARDHFQVVIVDDKLFATAGRQSDFPNTFGKTVAATDVYDFQTQQWTSAAPLPTPRAGAISVAIGHEIIVAGGEAAGQTSAFDVVEVLDVNTNTWSSLQPMKEGRHSGGGSIIGDRLHMISGSGKKGGEPELTTHESLLLDGGTPANDDSDNDGLSNQSELTTHGTDPNNPDSDGDTLTDGEEVNKYATDPANVDSDGDGLHDNIEIETGSSPIDKNDPGTVDGQADSGTDGSTDSGDDGGIDSGSDGASDSGSDGTSDAATDSGTDAGSGDSADAPVKDTESSGKKFLGATGAWLSLALFGFLVLRRSLR